MDSRTALTQALRLAGQSATARLELAALCVGNAVFQWVLDAQQVWLAEVVKQGGLSAANASWLASAELAMTGVGTFVVAVFGWRASPRLGATAAAAISVLANLV